MWQARVGRVTLYLLDSNDPLNSPADRGITSALYGGGIELRLMQEIVLGIGMERGAGITGARNGYMYSATVPASRPSEHFTPHIIPSHPEVRTPMEAPVIVWPR